MSEHSATIAREAKNIHQGVKELLKTKEPFDRDIEFQRKNLRRRYLLLLLNHPYAKESKDVENHLWMQTSYALIAVYKQRIASLDRLIQNQPRQQGNNHAVEYRKLLQRFRQFLSDEERFWTQLIVRYRRSFALDDAQSVLVSLGILSTTSDGQVMEGPDVSAPSPNARNNQFPLEDPENSVVPTSEAERESRMAILSKALICLGDIARYKEQYNENQGRSRVGHEDLPGSGKRGKSRKGPLAALPRPRNFTRAKQCYEKAQLLVPHEGNPSHQLAILSAYQKDSFASLVHYYRALCVRQPYDTASENMGTVLSKAYDQWRKEHLSDAKSTNDIALDESIVPKIRIEAMTDKIVVLHALWRFRLQKMDGQARKMAQSIYKEFYVLVSGRHLPEEMIISVVIASESALWKHQMLREPPPSIKKWKSEATPPVLMPAYAVEARMLGHVLYIHRALLEIGLEQLKDFPAIDTAEQDLAVLAQHRITPVFRRILPALRIAGKWLLANLNYVTQGAQGLITEDDSDMSKDWDRQQQIPVVVTDAAIGIPEFWSTLADFLRALSRAFAIDRLPTMRAPLAEDIDMRGFLPLRNMTCEDSATTMEDQEHPNVLNLMRVADLLNDAKKLVDAQNSPLALYGNHFMLKGVESGMPVLIAEPSANLEDVEEDQLTEPTSQTDDDPVQAAFRVLDDFDDNDEVIYPRESMPPVVPIPTRQSPVTPVIAPLSPIAHTPTHAKGKSPLVLHSPSVVLPAPASVAPTTAQDLVNSMMGSYRDIESSKMSPSKVLPSPAPPSTFLFGSDPNRPGQSIWTAAQDEQSLKFSSATHGTHSVAPQSNSFLPPPHKNPPQWALSTSVNTQPPVANQLPLSQMLHPFGRMADGHHQRTMSSMTPGQYISNLPAAQSELFGGYPAPPPPPHGVSDFGYIGQPSVTDPNALYYSSPPILGVNPAMHSRHLSLHDPRVGHAFMPPAMSQTWGTNG